MQQNSNTYQAAFIRYTRSSGKGVITIKFPRLPGSIRDVLKNLIDDEITIVLASGEKERVKVAAVVGDLLIATCDGKLLKFVDIGCICEVLASCSDFLDDAFNDIRDYIDDKNF
jgi:hypothetical protein